MDPIKMLKDDHRKVIKLFDRFEKLGERATATKREIVQKLIRELDTHALIEEQVFYPFVRQWLEDADDTVLEAYEEHHLVKRTLRELESMGPEDEMFKAKVIVLGEAVKHHIEEEEGEILPRVKKEIGREELANVARRMKMAKTSVQRGRRAA